MTPEQTNQAVSTRLVLTDEKMGVKVYRDDTGDGWWVQFIGVTKWGCRLYQPSALDLEITMDGGSVTRLVMQESLAWTDRPRQLEDELAVEKRVGETLEVLLRDAQARVRQLEEALAPFLAFPRWLSIGSHENTAEIRVSRSTYEKAREVLAAKENTSVPYPASEQIRHLAEATAHLFDAHDCDHHGWETWRAALNAAKGEPDG